MIFTYFMFFLHSSLYYFLVCVSPACHYCLSFLRVSSTFDRLSHLLLHKSLHCLLLVLLLVSMFSLSCLLLLPAFTTFLYYLSLLHISLACFPCLSTAYGSFLSLHPRRIYKGRGDLAPYHLLSSVLCGTWSGQPPTLPEATKIA
jgi:hypothetical protein